MKRMNSQKQSIIAGGLISSAGMFFAKFLGLFYAVPFNSIIGNISNVAIYGVAFNIYSYILNICLAGMPFAIAAMVAKYSARGDYQSALLVRKLSTMFMVAFGALAMILMIVLAAPFAPLLLPESAQGSLSNNIEVMRNVLMIVAIAVFFVPILSSLRGFYQGLKDMEIYALSQVLEQIARVVFLLVSSAVAVYIFQMDRTWAVYFGAFSTTIAAILGIIHLRFYDRKQMKGLRLAAAQQKCESVKDKGIIFRELFFISVPYLLSAILGYSDSIINSFVLKGGMEAYYLANGYGVEVNGTMVLNELGNAQLTVIIGAINYGVLKLMSIPMVLAPGFSSAILPHISAALALNNYKLARKNIRDCVETVLYIALPLCFCLFVYAKPIYAILFPPAAYPESAAVADQILSSEQSLELCVDVLKWFSIEAFLSTLVPILASLMMAVEYRGLYIKQLSGCVLLKFVIAYPLLRWFGYPGLVWSSVISMGVLMGLDFYILSKRFSIRWDATLRRIVVMVGGLLCLWCIAWLCDLIGLKGYGSGRLVGMVQLGISGLFALLTYFAFTYLFHLPQLLLHLDFSRIMRQRRRGS